MIITSGYYSYPDADKLKSAKFQLTIMIGKRCKSTIRTVE